MKAAMKAIALAVILAVPAGVQAKDKPKPSGLELQQIQARDFEVSYDVAFRSVVSVLQDAGYRIQEANKDSGLITGSASTKSGLSWGFFGGWGKKKKTPVVSAFVEPRGTGMARVRLSFVMAKTKSSLYGMSSSDEEPILAPAVYQEAFEKISQAIFVRQAMDDTAPASRPTEATPAAAAGNGQAAPVTAASASQPN